MPAWLESQAALLRLFPLEALTVLPSCHLQASQTVNISRGGRRALRASHSSSNLIQLFEDFCALWRGTSDTDLFTGEDFLRSKGLSAGFSKLCLDGLEQEDSWADELASCNPQAQVRTVSLTSQAVCHSELRYLAASFQVGLLRVTMGSWLHEAAVFWR